MADELLLEAWCRGCELSFDLWGETRDEGRTFQVDGHLCACPNCLSPVFLTDIHPKESLA